MTKFESSNPVGNPAENPWIQMSQGAQLEAAATDSAPTQEQQGFAGNSTTMYEAINASELAPKKRRFGANILAKFTKKPESVVGDMSNTLHELSNLGRNYKNGSLDNLTDGSLEKTGKFDQAREEILSGLQGEAITEDALRTNAQEQARVENVGKYAQSEIDNANYRTDGRGFQYSAITDLDSAYTQNRQREGAEGVASSTEQLRQLRDEQAKLNTQRSDAEGATLRAAQGKAMRDMAK